MQEAYRRAVDAILERDVDLVVHSGDVFDSVRPATHVIMGFLKQTARITLDAEIPYLIAAGNHETPRLRTTAAALEYANLVNATVAHGFEPGYELIRNREAGVGVTLVPHGAIASGVAVTPSHEADINILVTHGTVPGLQVRGREIGEADLHPGVLEMGFDYVALGHYHAFHAHAENAYYAGATERFGFGEVDSVPGFVVVEFSGGGVKVEHVPLPARPMLNLPLIDASNMHSDELTEAIRQRVETVDLEGAIVRLRITGAARGATGGIDRQMLRDLSRRCLNFSLEVSEAGAPPVLSREEIKTAFGSLEEEFKAFVQDRKQRGEIEPRFTAEFLERGTQYLRRAGSGEAVQR